MSSCVLVRRSVHAYVEHFECSNAIKIRNGINVRFLPGTVTCELLVSSTRSAYCSDCKSRVDCLTEEKVICYQLELGK